MLNDVACMTWQSALKRLGGASGIGGFMRARASIKDRMKSSSSSASYEVSRLSKRSVTLDLLMPGSGDWVGFPSGPAYTGARHSLTGQGIA